MLVTPNCQFLHAILTTCNGTSMKVVTYILSVLVLATPNATGQECAADGTCDTHERCQVWKEQGECTKSKEYMEKHCPVSCSAEPTASVSYNAECEDSHLKCPVWAKLGECQNNKEMAKHCAKSCNTCHLAEKDDNLCNDKHPNCQRWADLGECKNNPQYMHHGCARSCGTCKNVIKPAQSSTGVVDPHEEQKRSLEGATEKFGERQMSYAEGYNQALEVMKRSIEYMASDVVLSLPETIRDGCRNSHVQCSLWASVGECEANPGFMKKMCAPACMTCDWIK